jgi:hypothetical protein
MTKNRVHTWADGFGRWYASVPGDVANPRRTARDAIRRELEERGEIHAGFRVCLEEAPDYWLTQTSREIRPVFRERLQVMS